MVLGEGKWTLKRMAKVTIVVFTRHQKRFRLFAACFDKFWQNLCCYIFSVPLYIPVFSSLFSIILFNLLTRLRSFYFTVSVNIANTNFSRMTILDYVACFFTFSLFYIFPDILCQTFDPMIFNLFLALKTSYHILFTPMSQWAALSLD